MNLKLEKIAWAIIEKGAKNGKYLCFLDAINDWEILTCNDGEFYFDDKRKLLGKKQILECYALPKT